MSSVGENHIHQRSWKPDSFYSFVTSRYISRPIVPALIRIGLKNPNVVSSLSFAILLGAAVLLLLVNRSVLLNRLIVAFLIELAFVLDCADGQIARTLDRKSLLGAWLDKYFDRIGEMFLYSVIGYASWQDTGQFVFFVLGVLTGFLFSYYSLVYAEKDSIFLEEIKKNGYRLEQPSEKSGGTPCGRDEFFGKQYFRGSALKRLFGLLFFYLNIGMGERYLYPIVFIPLGKTHIMLLIVFFLFFTRSMNVTFILARHIVRNRM